MSKPLTKQQKERYSKPKLSETRKEWYGGGYYRKYTYTGDGGGSIKVPVAKNGKIPRKVLVARFLDEDEGTKPGQKKRSILHDINTDSAAYKQGSPQTFEWYRRPNKYDIKGIDEPQSNFFNTKKPKGDPDRGIVLIGPEKHTRRVAKHIDDSFTKKEKKKMKGLMIEVSRTGDAGGAAGYYLSQGSQGSGKRRDRAVRDIEYIKIGRDYTETPKTTVHEVTHYLRKNDKDRKGGLRAREGYGGRDRDYEEATTESETMARIKKYDHKDKPSGYWSRVKEQRDKEVDYAYGLSQSIDRDHFSNGKTREIHKELYDLGKELRDDINEKNRIARKKYDLNRKLTKEEEEFEKNYLKDRERKLKNFNKVKDKFVKQVEATEGKKGKLALRRVTKNFPNTKISSLKYYNSGKTEALDTYYAYEDPDGNKSYAHFYSPNAKIDKEKASKEAFGTTENVVEYQDGRPVKLKESYLEKKERSGRSMGPGKGWHGERMRHRQAALKRRNR